MYYTDSVNDNNETYQQNLLYKRLTEITLKTNLLYC